MPDPDPLPAIQMPWGSFTPASVGGVVGVESPPVSIPDHTLVRRIGRGSYGEVWLARNALGLHRAVKVLHRSAFSDDRPFEREFAGMQRFEPVSRSHESQLNILHVGRTPGHFYYVMELADDQGRGVVIDEATYAPRTLRSELLFRGRLPVDECIRLGLALTTALEHLHRHGLVHRDIKPSNIVFVSGIPKLADIGLVAQAERTMSFVGTEGYLPPEGPGTVQADVFSLGKVLYEIATGNDRQQFPELPTNVAELPDRAALAEFNEVIVRACAPDVKQRYQSAAEMHADLALLQSGKSVARAHSLERRLKFAARAGALVSGLAALAALGFFYQQSQTREARRLAAENARLADENRERLIRLDVANGIRDLDRDELASSLVWLTDALELATNNPADTAIQRLRIAQLLASHPRLLRILPHPAGAPMAEFSPDERRIVTACADGWIRIWDTDGELRPETEFHVEGPVGHVRFTHDGRHLYVPQIGLGRPLGRVTLLDAATGRPVFPPVLGVSRAALSPDDRWLAVARTNAAIQMIATETGRVIAEAIGHEDRVEVIEFSPDSTLLLTASRDHTVRRWRVTTGEPVGSPLRHSQPVSHALFNGDASRIATATAAEPDSTSIQFQTWDAATSRALGQPIPGFEASLVLGFDPCGQKLLTGDGDRMAHLWDADSHAAIVPALLTSGAARCHAFSPDGAYVAIGSESQTVRIWNVETGVPASPPLHHPGRAESVRFNGDGSRLLIASDDGTVAVWDLTQPPDDGQLRIKAFAAGPATISPDGRQLLLGVVDFPAYLQLVSLDPLQVVKNGTTLADAGRPRLVAFDRSGSQWASCPGSPWEFSLGIRPTNAPGTAILWRRDGEQYRYYRLFHDQPSRGVFFSADGRELLTLSDDRKARTWNTSDGILKKTVPWPEQDGAWLAVSPDLQTAVTVFLDGNGRHLRFRDVQSGKALGPSAEANPDLRALSFSPEGTRVATVGDNQSGRIWNLRTGQPLTPYFKHGGSLTGVEWSPDGRRVLTAGNSPEVKVWDADTGKPALAPLVMKSGAVGGAAFSADGRYVVTRSEEKLVRVWDATTGEAVTAWLPHEDNVLAAFVTAAPQLVTVSAQCVVRIWNLRQTPYPARDLREYAQLLAGHSSDSSHSPHSARPDELAVLIQSLRARHPELFVMSPDRLRAWHQQQARDPRSLDQLRATMFHLERLARLAPDDATVEEKLTHCRAALIPVRDPATPARLLDLTPAYTHSFELMQHGDFAELPRGRQRLGGIEFDLRGLVELNHRSERTHQTGPFRPAAVIQVGQHCRALHFLQAAEGEPRINDSTVARWIIHYDDGSMREWPVIYGRHLRDWWWWTEKEPLDASEAETVWRGRALDWNLPGTDGVRLFKSVWINPQPKVGISRLEFRMGDSSLKPFVVAITAE